jgi:hypothetical protein
VNTKLGERLTTSIHEDVLGRSFLTDQQIKFPHRVRPQRTKAELIALTPDLHGGMIPVWRMRKTEIAHAELRHFIGASAGIVQEQEQHVIAPSLCGVAIWRRKARHWAEERRALWVVSGGVVLGAVGLGTSGLSTLGGDGSELGAVARAVDRLGAPEVTLDAPDVPADYWRTLGAEGRMHTLVRTARAGETAELVLRRGGDAPGVQLITVRRRGAPLWTLARR